MKYKDILTRFFIIAIVILILFLFNKELELLCGDSIFEWMMLLGNYRVMNSAYISYMSKSVCMVLEITIVVIVILYNINYRPSIFIYCKNLIASLFLEKKILNLNICSICIIILYVIMVVAGVIYHEPWLDEAQSWLIARDLSVTGIIKQMSYEGSPSLWHFILFPFAKSGVPYISASIIHAVIAIITVTIFIIYSPFSILTRTLFVFSYYITYEYAVLARNYNITILCLFLLAIFYKKRFEKPVFYGILIFLLFNTNIHTFFMAGTLMCLYIFELYKKDKSVQHYIGILMMLAGSIIAFLQVLPARDCVIPGAHFASANSGLFKHFNHYAFIRGVYNAFFLGLPCISFIKLLILSLGILLLLIGFFIRKPSILFLLTGSYMWLCYIFSFKHPGYVRHYGLMLVFLIFFIWIGSFYEEKCLFNNRIVKFLLPKIFFIILNIGLLFSCIYNLNFYCREYKYNFSSSKEAAQFILKNHYDKYTLVGYDELATAPILPYLPASKIWYITKKNYGTFVIWNISASYVFSEEEIMKIIKEHFTDLSHVLVILNMPLKNEEGSGFRLIYNTRQAFGHQGAAYECYWIYKAIK